MRHAVFWWPTAACALLPEALAASAGAVSNPYIDEEDHKVVEDAQAAVATYCAAGFAGELDGDTRANARAALESGVGGTNVMMSILSESESSKDLGKKAGEKITFSWLFWQALPVTMTLVMLLVWSICCWSACPCCRCCRCCTRGKQCHPCVKALAPLCIVGLFFGICYCVSVAGQGYGKSKDGFDNAACVTARILNTSLAGQEGPMSFIGMMGVLEAFWALDQKLETGSTFLNDIQALLDSTLIINDATAVAGGTLNLLAAVMDAEDNVRPKAAADGADLLHQCTFCAKIVPTVREAASALGGGVGSALANLHSEVATQLSPAVRRDLQETFRTSAQPMLNFKRSIRDTFAFFVDTDQFERLNNALETQVYFLVHTIFAAVFLVMGCALCSGFWYALRDKGEIDESPGEKQNPYHKGVHRCACCAWQCGFLYTLPAFFVGGIMTAVTVPLSGMCILMDDMDRQMIQDIAPAIGLNLTGDQGTMLLDLAESCVATKDATLNANLLDLIFVRDDNSTQQPPPKVFLREKILSEVRDPLNAKFEAITAAKGNSTSLLSLGDNAAVMALRNIFRVEDIRSLILADADRMNADPTLQDLALDSRGDDGVAVGLVASSSCQDHTVQADIGDLKGNTNPGIETFVNSLQAFGTLQADSSCAKAVTCGSASPPDSRICSAGNRYVELKRGVLSSDRYRCDLFEDPAGQAPYCDPLHMLQTGGQSGPWVSDCLFPDGAMKVKPRTCNLADFASYAQSYDLRIKKVMSRLDATVGATMNTINNDMRAALDEHLIGVVQAVAEGVTCGYLPQRYHEMVDALCYQGVWGFKQIGNSYVASAFVTIFLMLVMYIVWRLAIDNVNAWDQENAAGMTSVVPV